jgi:hypothetical protein
MLMSTRSAKTMEVRRHDRLILGPAYLTSLNADS